MFKLKMIDSNISNEKAMRPAYYGDKYLKMILGLSLI